MLKAEHYNKKFLILYNIIKFGWEELFKIVDNKI